MLYFNRRFIFEKMNKKNMIKQTIIIPMLILMVSCMQLPPDKKNLIKGDEAINRLKQEAKAIDNFYFSNNAKDALPYKSAHLIQPDWIIPVVIKINPKKNYDKESVNDCIKNIRTIGFPMGGVQSIITCDIKEAAVIDIGPLNTGNRSVEKNEKLLQLLSLP